MSSKTEDAARYRWLRSRASRGGPFDGSRRFTVAVCDFAKNLVAGSIGPWSSLELFDEGMDAEVDAQMHPGNPRDLNPGSPRVAREAASG